MMKCKSCGADIKYDPKLEKIKCEYCGSEFDPKEYDGKKVTAKKQISSSGYKCTQCGAELLTFDETAVTFCNYCGSSSIIEEKLIAKDQPDYIIPFKITKEEAIKLYKNKIKKSLFAPKYMKEDVTVNKFRGIYMPYGIFNLKHSGKCTNKGSKYSHRSGDYDIYDDFTITADVEAEYKGISYDLLSKFYDRYSEAIGPFNYNEAEEFNSSYMSGFYADSLDVDASKYDNSAKTITEKDCNNIVGKNKEFRKYGCLSPKIPLNIDSHQIAYYPVYFLAIRDKSNTRISYAVINGQTGKVAIDIPVSFPKYIITSLILAICFFALLMSFVLLTPKVTLIISLILSLISMIVLIIEAKKEYQKEHNLEDINTKEIKKMPFKDRIKKALKQIIGMVIIIITLIVNPIDDIYYYIPSLISLILVIISFYDLIKEHNLLVSRNLPQLDKRGGDK